MDVNFYKILIGSKFGAWTVLGFERDAKTKHLLAKCKCDCGTERFVRFSSLQNGASVSCGKCSYKSTEPKKFKSYNNGSRRKVKLGTKYNLVTVIGEVESKDDYNRVVKCQCDCGNEFITRASYLSSGRIKSCSECDRYNQIVTKMINGESLLDIIKEFPDIAVKNYDNLLHMWNDIKNNKTGSSL